MPARAQLEVRSALSITSFPTTHTSSSHLNSSSSHLALSSLLTEASSSMGARKPASTGKRPVGRPRKVTTSDRAQIKNPLPSDDRKVNPPRSSKRTKAAPKRFADGAHDASIDVMEIDLVEVSAKGVGGEEGKGRAGGRTKGKGKGESVGEVEGEGEEVEDEYREEEEEADIEEEEELVLGLTNTRQRPVPKKSACTARAYTPIDDEEAGDDDILETAKAVKNLLGMEGEFCV